VSEGKRARREAFDDPEKRPTEIQVAVSVGGRVLRAFPMHLDRRGPCPSCGRRNPMPTSHKETVDICDSRVTVQWASARDLIQRLESEEERADRYAGRSRCTKCGMDFSGEPDPSAALRQHTELHHSLAPPVEA
jgi:hypothetical protein